MFPIIDCICGQIVGKFAPREIILFNLKQSVSGDPRSFKICIVIETADKESLERQIYLGVECEIPYDVLVYTPSEWSALSAQAGTFAHRIREKGTVLYEQAP